MTISLNFTGDLAVMDGHQTASLERKRTSILITGLSMLRRQVSVKEAAASGGDYTTSDVKWHVAAPDLADPPEAGDVVVGPDGVRWSVIEVDVATISSRYCMWCKKAAVADYLDDRADVLRATWSKGEGGAQVAKWVAGEVSIAVKFVQRDEAQRTDGGKLAIPEISLAYAEAGVELDESCRIVRKSDGSTWQIIGVADCDRLDAVRELTVKRV